MDPDMDRSGQLDAEVAALYREVERLEGECESISKDKGGDRYYVLDLQSRTLREQARMLTKELEQSTRR
jgi:hypothetical protein